MTRWRLLITCSVFGAIIGGSVDAWQRAKRQHTTTNLTALLASPLRPITLHRTNVLETSARLDAEPLPPCVRMAMDVFALDHTLHVGAMMGWWKTDAFVLPGRDTMFITLPPELLPPGVFAHEMTHLIQDQYLHVNRLMADQQYWDGKLALRATLEAVAHLVAGEHPDDSPRTFSNDWSTNVERFVHVESTRWLRHRWADAPLETSRHAPGSTYAILYPANPTPTIQRPTPTGAEQCVDMLGPLAVMTAVFRATNDGALTEAAGRAWRGDMITSQMAADGAIRAHWVTHWDPIVPTAVLVAWRTINPDTGRVVASSPTRTP